jgi:hypothetical protein
MRVPELGWRRGRSRRGGRFRADTRLLGASGFGEGTAEDKVLAQRPDLRASLHKLQIPVAVARLAVEHGADKAVVAHEQLLVEARHIVA